MEEEDQDEDEKVMVEEKEEDVLEDEESRGQLIQNLIKTARLDLVKREGLSLDDFILEKKLTFIYYLLTHCFLSLKMR